MTGGDSKLRPTVGSADHPSGRSQHPGHPNQVVLITGAAGGIGSALAQRYARAGAGLILLDLDAEGLARISTRLTEDGTQVVTCVCDLTDEGACRAAVAEGVAVFGGVDILINNAGRTHLSFVDETESSVFRRIMDINFFGAVHVTLATLPSLLERRGSIAVMSSVAGFAPLSGRSGYAASKHALHGFFESLRGEVAARGVRVTMVCPSFTRSGIGSNALGAREGAAPRPQTMTGRTMEPEEVADAVFRGVERGRRLIVLSPVGKLSYLLSRFAPRIYESLMVRRLVTGTRSE
jgi:NAD(P)-dependent dehydrogenase (short-subunit alcohol dehydrogenase family)